MNLTTSERFLLLAKNPSNGRFISSDIYLYYGLVGSILLEMSFEGMFTIENKRLILKDGTRTTNPIYLEIVERIKKSKKPRKLSSWISIINRKSRKYKWIVLKDMAQKHILTIEQKRFLGLIPYRRCSLNDQNVRNTLISQLKNGVLYKKETNDELIVLLSLIEACRMHKILTRDRAELKILRKNLKEILKENPIASEVANTIKQVQIAIAASIAVSTAVAATR
jgi:hypothetical protein